MDEAEMRLAPLVRYSGFITHLQYINDGLDVSEHIKTDADVSVGTDLGILPGRIPLRGMAPLHSIHLHVCTAVPSNENALNSAWDSTLRPRDRVEMVLIAASTLLIVSASFERYVCSFSSSAGIKSKNRMLVIAVVILSAIIMKGSVYFELELQTLPNCRPLTNLRLDLSEITRSDLYKTVWMFWCRNFLNVFLPFSLLLLLNSATIANLNKHSREFIAEQLPSLLPGGTHASLARRKKKDATRTLAALVTIYLLSNTLNLLLTIMEFIDPEFLRELGEGRVYK
ncbi:hypothetical protein ANCCEY_09793 [Ancylostoma ceylanicum]|uniref:G-protein coupled receptors family 1 profile domain-containing protein n=1 Tax=Ancylostoma ceylanicum TaxID=53326 RepID=A0A0D6LM32_9BILA|nr:hypothetical protein ANCCEY_09793 [Ancylostoma ceylanicum]